MSNLEKGELENREEVLDENEDLKNDFVKIWYERGELQNYSNSK